MHLSSGNCNSTYRLRYWNTLIKYDHSWWYFRLQQYLPFTVLKRFSITSLRVKSVTLQQHLSFTVLKQFSLTSDAKLYARLQQYLPFTVCAEVCETAEEQSDDEVRTSQVPEQSEGKTKAISNSTYRLRYAPKCARQQRSKVTMRSAHLLSEQSEGETKVMRK